MTPIKAIVWYGAQVFVLDHAEILELKCVAVSERDAEWLAGSLGRAHVVPVVNQVVNHQVPAMRAAGCE